MAGAGRDNALRDHGTARLRSARSATVTPPRRGNETSLRKVLHQQGKERSPRNSPPEPNEQRKALKDAEQLLAIADERNESLAVRLVVAEMQSEAKQSAYVEVITRLRSTFDEYKVEMEQSMREMRVDRETARMYIAHLQSETQGGTYRSNQLLSKLTRQEELTQHPYDRSRERALAVEEQAAGIRQHEESAVNFAMGVHQELQIAESRVQSLQHCEVQVVQCESVVANLQAIAQSREQYAGQLNWELSELRIAHQRRIAENAEEAQAARNAEHRIEQRAKLDVRKVVFEHKQEMETMRSEMGTYENRIAAAEFNGKLHEAAEKRNTEEINNL